MRILVIEDDRLVADLMRQVLMDDGYAVDVAPVAEDGRNLALANPYDAIVLDLELPDRNGLTVLQELRREGSTTPIVVATAHDTAADVVRAAIRRGGARSMERVQVGDLTLHRVQHEVYCHGKLVSLTARQYALLEFLAMRAGETVTRPILLEHVWHLQFDPGSNVVDVHVAQLRKRLRESGSTVDIRTVRGEGYALDVG
jgi:DNA-binding response OmpR family regulator